MRHSLKNTIISIALSTNIFLQTSNIAKLLLVTLRHGAQWTYDHLPAEIYDVPRGRTLFSNIPIVPGTIGYYARILDCIAKSAVRGEILVNGSIIKQHAMDSLYALLANDTSSQHMDGHVMITMGSITFSTLIYYCVIKPNDFKIELQRNRDMI